MNKKILLFSLFIVFAFSGFTQQSNYPLSRDMTHLIEKEAAFRQAKIHTSAKPMRQSDWSGAAESIDSSLFETNRWGGAVENWNMAIVWKSIFTHDFIRIDGSNYHLAFNPVLNADFGKDRVSDSSFRINSRGLEFKGSLGANFSFYSNIIENQTYYPQYIDQFIRQQTVVPGQGVYKLVKNGSDTTAGFDFFSSSGHISYSPFQFLNFQLGNSKHFIGNGYRSLLLSDNTYNYPSFQTTIDYKNFRYSWILAEFQNFEGKYYNYHTKKHASFMYLNWNPNWRFELGLFEAAIWKTSDVNANKQFPFGFFNPIILTHALQYGLDADHNVLLGLNTRFNPDQFSQIYCQLLIDDLNFSKFSDAGYFHNKYGYQIGAKLLDVFRHKIKNASLYIQAEYNKVKPYTYATVLPYQSYSNQNQALAHPLGSGFNEFMGIVKLQYADFFAEIKICSAQQAYNLKRQNFGGSVFASDLKAVNGMESSGNTIENSPNVKIVNTNFIVGYTINYRYWLQVYFKVDRRQYDAPDYTNKLDFVSLGLRTNINNYYFDF